MPARTRGGRVGSLRPHAARLSILLALALWLTGCAAAPTSSGIPPTAQTPATSQPRAASPETSSPEALARPASQSDPPATPRPAHALRVHFIDVGQGDSILIQAPDGTTALIDGGYAGSGTLAYLRTHGIGRIDVLIASHPHADHIGGLIDVLRAMPVGAVWTSGASHTTSTFEDFLEAIADAKVPYHEAAQGDALPCGDLVFAVLHSLRAAPDLNDTSLVLRLQYGLVSFLFTGDAERDSEHAMLREVADQLPSTILKVGHHGSYSSSSPEFLAVVRPAVAVYSAGANNDYGHPHDSVIHNLQRVQARIYGTDTHGTVVISTDGTSYTIATSNEALAASATTAPIASPIPSQAPAAAPLSTPTVATTPQLRYDPNGRDRDCGSFETQAEAQMFFIAAGGPARDSHRLDGDDDGIACESLP